MPIFAYRCDACGFEKDVLQKRSDPPLSDCPECGQAAFRKQLAAPAFQLKGSGWYVTDFRDGNKGKAKDGGKAGAGAEPAAGSAGAGTGAGTGASPAGEPGPAAAPSAGAASGASTPAPSTAGASTSSGAPPQKAA